MLTNELFLEGLDSILQKQKTTQSGTLFFSMKRHIKEGTDSFSTIIRAKTGKTQLVTLVHPQNSPEFMLKFTLLVREKMDTLKRKSKSKNKNTSNARKISKTDTMDVDAK